MIPLLFSFQLLAADPLLQSPYHPSYMILQGANYGGHQADYLRRSQKMIYRAKKEIETAVETNQNLPDLFFKLLKTMAKERGDIAKDHKTEHAEEFGLRRDREAASESHTRLNKPGYTQYEKKVRAYLTTLVSKMRRSKHHFLEKKHSFTGQILGRTSLIEIEIFDKADIEKEGWLTAAGRLKRKLPEWFPSEICSTQYQTSSQKKQLYHALKRLWREDPKGYQWLEKGYNLPYFAPDLPPHYDKLKFPKINHPIEWMKTVLSLKTILAEVTVFFEINGKLQPLYGYFTALYQNQDDREEDLLTTMGNHSVPLLIHQRQFLIEETLKEVSTIFEQIVRWKGNDLTELKQLMALFRFEMGCMPFLRGSSAITEWLEAALYSYHQISYRFDEKRHADLEVYLNPLFSDFIKAYDSICILSLN